MNRYQTLVYQFQEAYGIYPLPSHPTPLTPDAVALWRKLIAEERDELLAALASGDIVSIVHEQCDLLYVLYGSACWMGVTVHGVHRTPVLFHPTHFINTVTASVWCTLAWRQDYRPYRNAIRIALNVVYGCTAVYDLWPAFQAIHAANMAKLAGNHRRADGKLLKPDGWQPADIASVLRAQGLLTSVK